MIKPLLFSLLVLDSLFLSAKVSLEEWTVEDQSGKAVVQERGDTLDITSPEGLTLWYDNRLEGDYEISYSVTVLTGDGAFDRLSDLNCFWGAKDPASPDDFFQRSDWRGGLFDRYNSLNLFYVGFGGNENTTTRFRQYYGGSFPIDSPEVKPLISEYADSAHLLSPDTWYRIRIRVRNGRTAYIINGKKLFDKRIGGSESDGHFGLRLYMNHILFTNFKIRA